MALNVIFLCFILTSCIKDKGIPSYVYIDSIQVEVANPSEQGSSSSKITEAWVFVNDQTVGAYQLPARIPLLYGDKQSLKIAAGILENGISATRTIYPYYHYYEINTQLIRDSVLILNPVVSYHENTEFRWIEDFEDNRISLQDEDISDVDIIRVQDPSLVYEGTGSGAVYLDSSSPRFKLGTENAYALPKDGTPVFLEVDYKNDIIFTMGIIAITAGGEIHQTPILKVNPSNKWNKIYMNITPEIGIYQDAIAFQLIFFGELTTGDKAAVYFDNFKLIH